MAIVGLGGLIFLYSVMKKAMPKDVIAEIDEMRRRLESETAPVPAPETAPMEKEVVRMKQSIKEMVSKNPRGVANILRRWISGK